MKISLLQNHFGLILNTNYVKDTQGPHRINFLYSLSLFLLLLTFSRFGFLLWTFELKFVWRLYDCVYSIRFTIHYTISYRQFSMKNSCHYYLVHNDCMTYMLIFREKFTWYVAKQNNYLEFWFSFKWSALLPKIVQKKRRIGSEKRKKIKKNSPKHFKLNMYQLFSANTLHHHW